MERTQIPLGIVDEGSQVVLLNVRPGCLLSLVQFDGEGREVLDLALDGEVV
jgi:hypothetical protein